MSHFLFTPATIAATLLAREQAAASGEGRGLHALAREEGVLRVRYNLFVLSTGDWTLTSPLGHATLDAATVRATEPDPLWESADDICSHMEQDHAETFPLFVKLAGRAGLRDEPIGMPWVQSQGFVLSTPSDFVFVSFPEACFEPNAVRATLIKMLRKARANDG